MKTLGITIDGVLRDLENQFEKTYRKAFIHNESLVGMDENFNAIEEEQTDEYWDNLKKLEEENFTFPIDSADLTNHFKFESKEKFEQFLYEDYNFQILGAANAYPKSFDYLLRIQGFGESNKLFDTTLVSKENGKSITSTMHFLAKSASRIRNIKFIDNNADIWKSCDVVITDLPEILDSKPEGKISIRINKLYNQWSKADYSFDNLSEVNDKTLLSNLFLINSDLALQK